MNPSPVAEAMWDLLFNIHSNEIGVFLFRELKILSLRAVDIEYRQRQQESQEWLNKVQDAVYRTEDFVDKIRSEALDDSLDAKSQTKKSNKHKIHFRPMWVRKLPFWPKHKKRIKGEVKKIVVELRSLCLQRDASYRDILDDDDILPDDDFLYYDDFLHCERQRNSYNEHHQRVLQQDIDRYRRLSTFFVADSEVFCRDRDEEAIIELLLSDDGSGERLSVIPIVGEGGMGKTTLARRVYDNHRVSEHFDLKAWAWFPGKGDLLQATKAIVESFTSQSCDLEELTSLQHRLCEILKNKKFLIVLDDVLVENYDSWSRLLNPFIDAAAKGSRIMVTTPNQAVESTMRTKGYNSLRITAYYLKPLSDEECWSIFVKYAFGDERLNSNPELEDIGRQFVRKCSGVPLAVRTLGALLFNRLEANKKLGQLVEGWRTKLDRFIKDYRSPDVLRLSYENLPARLKRCFAYCSIFPAGYEFEKDKLILLWMAEGLLPQIEGNLTPEEFGDYYFHELFHRSFILRSSGNESHFVIHNLMNDLAIAVSGEFCFKLEDNSSSHISERARYLLLSGKYDPSMIFEVIDKAKFLRTFLPLDHESCHLTSNELRDLLPKLQFLRVLSLSHYDITELPDSISDLKHLRYMDLSHTAIRRLPESVCALRKLQTLILSHCRALTELPENMWKLFDLRHLDISGTGLNEMPKEMSRLKNLQTLSDFVVGKESGSTIKELGRLPYLHGTLRISKLQNMVSPEDAVEAKLKEKAQLDELMLEWDDDTADREHDREMLTMLEPHRNLKKLSIKFYQGTSFRGWLGSTEFPYMVFLCLSNCKKCLSLPPFCQLPSLEVLIIEGMDKMKKVGPDFCGPKMQFRSLKSLTFDGMLEWEEWNQWISLELPGGEFPCLQELCIRRCPKLKGNLPKQFPSIKKVEIFDSQVLVSTLLSLKWRLHYHDKILFRSDDKAESFIKQRTVFTHEGAAESSMTITQGVTKSSLPNTWSNQHGRHNLSSSEIVEISEETDLPIGPHRHKLEGSYALEDIPEGVMDTNLYFHGNMLLRSDEGAAESSLPSQTPDTEDAHVLTDQDGLEDLSSFEIMEVSEISQLMELPAGLHGLKIEGCDALEDIPEGMMDNKPSLQHLYIFDCYSLKSFPEKNPTIALKVLYIQNCKRLDFLPPASKTNQYALLEHLCLGSSCDPLISLPLGFFPKLKSLSIWDCANLESLTMPEGIQKDLTSLEALEIRDCQKLVSFPEGGLPAPNLTSIWFSNCKSLKELPKKLHTLISLQSMFVNNCPELISLSEGGLPSNLCLLSITFCDKIMLGMEWGLHRLDRLSQLEIEGGCKNVESFPEEKLLPSNLNSLCISRFSNLKYLDYNGLQHLTALNSLEISSCDELQSLPEEGLPSSLSLLCIKECSLLKSKLLNNKGKEWFKLAHISCIEIDDEIIKRLVRDS